MDFQSAAVVWHPLTVPSAYRRHKVSHLIPADAGPKSRALAKRILSATDAWWSWLGSRWKQSDLSIFHQFRPAPEGGGHQFLRALWKEFQSQGIKVENNTISPTTRACLFNSFNFDFYRLRFFSRPDCRLVHRVDGPIGVYRGWDNGTDKRLWELNHEVADATVFQSQFSLAKHLELGLEFKNPTVIMNSVDPALFFSSGRVRFDRHRKIRLISTSWSDNPNKGSAVYSWLERHLDWSRYEYTFVGRCPISFEKIQTIQPVPSAELANLLRDHDIYITASMNDPCSNSLLEALACGLPAIYIKSGGHPEIVGNAGLPFSLKEELPDVLEEIVEQYEFHQKKISVPSISSVAEQYLRILFAHERQNTHGMVT